MKEREANWRYLRFLFEYFYYLLRFKGQMGRSHTCGCMFCWCSIVISTHDTCKFIVKLIGLIAQGWTGLDWLDLD